MTLGTSPRKVQSYAWQISDAMQADAASPERLLCLAVIARFIEDRRRDPATEDIDEGWALMAGVPPEWMQP